MPIYKSSGKIAETEVIVEENPRRKKKRNKKTFVRLAPKLKRIRLNHSLTQGEMLKVIHPEDDDHNRSRICQLETGMRVPTIEEIWSYAKFARVSIECLIDDERELPKRFL